MRRHMWHVKGAGVQFIISATVGRGKMRFQWSMISKQSNKWLLPSLYARVTYRWQKERECTAEQRWSTWFGSAENCLMYIHRRQIGKTNKIGSKTVRGQNKFSIFSFGGFPVKRQWGGAHLKRFLKRSEFKACRWEERRLRGRTADS